MEYLSFGPMLERCRNTYLKRLGNARHALVLGDGDGRFLARLLAVNPGVMADIVDSSSSMLQRLKQRVGGTDHIRLHHADALAWEPVGSYDLVVTHFFLDCFFPEQLEQLCDRVVSHTALGAQWIVSEFAIPANPILAPFAKALVRVLYSVFKVLTGLPVRVLPDYAIALRKRGLVLREERLYLCGLLAAQIWAVPGANTAISAKFCSHSPYQK